MEAEQSHPGSRDRRDRQASDRPSRLWAQISLRAPTGQRKQVSTKCRVLRRAQAPRRIPRIEQVMATLPSSLRHVSSVLKVRTETIPAAERSKCFYLRPRQPHRQQPHGHARERALSELKQQHLLLFSFCCSRRGECAEPDRAKRAW